MRLSFVTASLLLALQVSAQDQTSPESSPPSQHTRIVTGGQQWGANYFPNFELTNQDGQKFKFFDDCIKDRVVLLSFIYTTCPDACPLETARIAQVQGILGDRVGKDVFFYSITIDPKNDTPAVMKEYAQRYQAGPGWQFLTGDESEIAKLRMKLGLFNPADGTDLEDHTLNIVIGNQATGRWMRSGPFENPYVLARQIGDWLHNWKLPPQKDLEYKDAPKLRNISTGESLFRTRCSSCHAVGGNNATLARLGPNLFGVTDRRDRAWLKRWIMEPDVMLAEKDPIAMPLFEAFNKVPMPNMRIEDEGAEDLLAYLEEETQRLAKEVPTITDANGVEKKPTGSCCEKSDKVVVGDVAGDEVAAATPTPTVPPGPEQRPFLSTTGWISLSFGAVLAVVAFLMGRRGQAG